MKILIINKSRLSGVGNKIRNSIVDILERGNIVDCINLQTINIIECTNCGGCAIKNKCVNHHNIHDDYMRVLNKINEADLIINIMPMYNAQPPAEFKALVDRGQLVYHSKYTHGNSLINRNKDRKGINIITCGSSVRKQDDDLMLACMRHFDRNYNVKNTDNNFIYDIDTLTEDVLTKKINILVNNIMKYFEKRLNKQNIK